LLAVALARHGHRVELLVASGRDIGELSAEWARNYEASGVAVRVLERVPGIRPPYLAPSLEVFQALHDEPPDVAIVDDWRGIGYVAMRARQTRGALADTAFVVHCHGPARVLAAFAQKVPDTVARFGEEIAERASIELADAVVSPSAWLLEWMRRHRWPVPESAQVIPHIRRSVALDEIPPRAPRPSEIRRIAFFGQLREGKGIRLFVSALNALDPTLLDGCELVFLGAASKRWTPERIEAAIGADAKARVVGVRFETGLEREEALAFLRHPATLAVMPSLLDNSPSTVVECIEHGIPFVATDTGGIAELVAPEDRPRVLCRPTTRALTDALRRALTSRPSFRPAQASGDAGTSLTAWLDVVANIAPATGPRAEAATRVALIATGEPAAGRARKLAEHTQAVAVDVITGESRQAGAARAAADWIIFLDDDDWPDAELIDSLVAAQAASGADVVTAAVRRADESGSIQLFLGDPGALGLLENAYGVIGLVRKSLVRGPLPDAGVDPDWPFFARLALGGARIVSIPEAFSAHSGRIGRVSDVPGDGLAVLEAFEEAGGSVPDLPQLAATVAAALHPSRAEGEPSSDSRPLAERVVHVVRAEGLRGVWRRTKRRVGRTSPAIR
jgi:glycosyltransferase involved in cell wall biosynthesis